MVREIANEIARKVSMFKYTHIVGGYSRSLNSTGQTYPVCQNIYQNGKEQTFKGDYYPMIPNQSDSSIMFIELNASTLRQPSIGRFEGAGIGSIYFWGNTCLFEGRPSIQVALLQDLNIDECSTEGITISVETTGIVEHQAKQKYKLTSENEYLDMHPYQLFQINFSFMAHLNKCPVNIIVKNEC